MTTAPPRCEWCGVTESDRHTIAECERCGAACCLECAERDESGVVCRECEEEDRK